MQDRVAVIDGRAIVGPSAVAEPRGETKPIAAILGNFFPIVELRAPATLDWGDVLVTEDALFVGLSERSNEAAVRQLRELLAPDRMVEGVAVPPELLHLLSGCAYLGRRAPRSRFPRGLCRGARLLGPAGSRGGAAAANVLAVGRDVVVPAGYPETAPCPQDGAAGPYASPSPSSKSATAA